ncbi:MAG: HD domain-containing protein [Planctomycetia bacterium]|nr:HD domain-containing protein [Planctomycetia bacterium]
MAHRFINQLKENDSISEVYQITEKILRPNKNGNLYLQFTMTDRTGSLSGRLWNATEDFFLSFSENDFLLCEGAIQRFQGNLQFIAKKLTKTGASTVNLDDYARSVRLDLPVMIGRLREILKGIQNPDLLNLADCFLADENFMDLFCRMPAGIKLHHAYEGGLLEHTLSVMELALKTAAIYGSRLNRDLLLIGAFLHDTGKVRELSLSGGMIYTDEGQMLGHPLLALEILLEKIRETEKLTGETFDSETAMLLKHLLISHHGTLENGSTKLPMTLEALVLFYLDSLDAKLAEFEKRMLEDPSAGSKWTNYIPVIERKLYKG